MPPFNVIASATPLSMPMRTGNGSAPIAGIRFAESAPDRVIISRDSSPLDWSQMRRRTFLSLTTSAALSRPLFASLERAKLDQAAAFIRKWVDDGKLRAAGLHVRQGSYTFRRVFGEAKTPDTIFLLASITKPMTAVGMMVRPQVDHNQRHPQPHLRAARSTA